MEKISDILNTIKRATAFDLFLISFFALPFVFSAWLDICTKLNWGKAEKTWSLVVLLALYIFGVILMYFGNRAEKQRRLAKDQIIGYLQSKNFTMISFDRVRQKINQAHSNKFLEQVIEDFPQELRRAKLKGNKPGLARLVIENDDAEEA